MAKKNRKRTTGKLVSVDFTDVETRELIPEGDYHVRVEDIEQEEGTKGAYLNWVLKIPSGEYKGKKLYYVTSLTKQSLWNLRAVLEALGIEVPKSKMSLDLPSYKGLEMGVTVEIEKYKGRDKNVIVDVWNLEDEDSKDSEDEEPDVVSDEEPEEVEEDGEQEESSDDDSDEDQEYTGTIKEIEEDVLTVDIDDEEVDVYTEDAEVEGEPVVGATVVIKGSYDEDQDLIATEVTVKAKAKKTEKTTKKSKKSKR